MVALPPNVQMQQDTTDLHYVQCALVMSLGLVSPQLFLSSLRAMLAAHARVCLVSVIMFRECSMFPCAEHALASLDSAVTCRERRALC